ncbi:5'-nucleotidase C-terminal domain-containing protein [Tateyamaria omphalii]|uniref:5'-nucleotidase C-terminal domain-containing protein n=1 Tax=Tateyamaria omphalii TaxID=299262 RepID=UPI001C99DBB5|nr:5'-nucleotidase C-terminal domain-containing protein [Tateyamaria omphalii]MBY5934627.1 5'-nucleotidase C-terminal domain-containing protein [Tateyamaria omphalii]
MTVTSAQFRIAATSDVHMHLTGWDALRDTSVDGRGMDRLASVIKEERAGAPGGWALFDNGDALQGTPLGDHCVDEVDRHPWPTVLNTLGYDAVGLGNHDFDFGLPFLEAVMQQVDCPVLCANATSTAMTCTQAHTLLDQRLTCSDGQVRQLRLGVTSVLPPQTGVWNRRCLDGSVRFEGGVQAARAAVCALRALGADLVIALCHSGLTDGIDATGENFATAIASDVPGVDAMILGHTHLRFPGPDHAGFAGVDAHSGTLHGVPAVMPAHAGSELGLVDLALTYDDGWHVTSHQVRRRGVCKGTVSDAAITEITRPFIAASQSRLNTPLADLSTHWHSWFSMLRPSATEALVARAVSTTIANAVAGTDLANLPLLSGVAPAALGGRAGAGNYVDIQPGAFRERHIAMLSPYPNTIWAAVLTGAEIWDWIDRSLVYFAEDSGPGSALINPDAPAFNFDTIYGVEAEIDLCSPAAFDVNGHRVRRNATRVHRLRRRGRDVDPHERFVLAMTSYRAAGGGNFPGIGPHTRTVRTDIELRAALRAEVMRDDALNAVQGALPWHFVGTKQTRRVIQTAPSAADHLSDIAAFEPRVLGLDDDGFLRLEVTA